MTATRTNCWVCLDDGEPCAECFTRVSELGPTAQAMCGLRIVNAEIQECKQTLSQQKGTGTMATKTATRTAQNEAIERVREWYKVGDTVYTVRRAIHVYQVVQLHLDPKYGPGFSYPGWNISKAIGARWSEANEGIIVDTPFDIALNLGYALYPNGFECIGERCPSNDHSNGDRDYTPHHHESGGYAFRHERI